MKCAVYLTQSMSALPDIAALIAGRHSDMFVFVFVFKTVTEQFYVHSQKKTQFNEQQTTSRIVAQHKSVLLCQFTYSLMWTSLYLTQFFRQKSVFSLQTLSLDTFSCHYFSAHLMCLEKQKWEDFAESCKYWPLMICGSACLVLFRAQLLKLVSLMEHFCM